MNKNLYKLIILIFILIIPKTGFAALELKFGIAGQNNQKINTEKIPVFEVRVQAFQDGNPIVISKENLVIIESNYSIMPFEVSEPQNGWQVVKWFTRQESFPDRLTLTFILTYDNELTLAYADLPKPIYSQVIILENNGPQIVDLYMGSFVVGDTGRVQVIVNALKGKMIDDREQLVQIDSITFTNDDFYYHWQGNEFNMNPPPVAVEPGAYNLVDIYFVPRRNGYYNESMSVHYDNGRVKTLKLYANNFLIESTTLLQVKQPNGGEILEPCTNYEIKWDGYARGLKTNVHFSPDGGSNWIYLGDSPDSVFNWTVPHRNTERGLIKVTQEFTNTGFTYLENDIIPIEKLAFNSDGSVLLAADEKSQITEWDYFNEVKNTIYKINDSFYPSIKTDVFGLDFISDNKFVAAYKRINMPVDSLAFFDLGNENPVRTIPVNPGYLSKKMETDSKRELLAFVPVLSNKVRILSSKDGSVVKDLVFPYPVWSFDFNDKLDSAAVYLLNGEIRILSVPSFNVVQTIDVSQFPVIREMSLSPNGKLLAVGCTPPAYTIGSFSNTEFHVIDLNTETAVRSFRGTSSNPVSLQFSPTSNIVVIGSEAQPQVAFWDMPSGQYIGNLAGSTSMVTDLKFSPEGHSVAIGSVGFDNLIKRSFTYPEQDISEDYFSIVVPKIDVDTISLAEKFVATDNPENLVRVVCNTSEVPITFNSMSFIEGIHFYLPTNPTPFTLGSGDCVDINIVFAPKDVGPLRDTLVLHSDCNGDFNINIDSYSKPRNISLLRNEFDFGEQCVGQTLEREFNILRNEDPVPLKINRIDYFEQEGNPFGVKDFLIDTIIPPHSEFSYPLTFTPNELGPVVRTMRVYHSDLDKLYPEAPAKGVGIGSFIGQSHNYLMFIPEIKTRELTLYNTGVDQFEIEDIIINPEGNYIVTSSLPVVIPPGDSAVILIEWIGGRDEAANITVEAKPCASVSLIQAGLYSAESEVSIPVVEADPRGKAVIPIEFKTVENHSYKGNRPFTAEITINPRLFLPEKVLSEYGTGEVIKNEIIDDKRHIGIRVVGDFPPEGTVAYIHGLAGIAETMTSPIEFVDGSDYWSTAVETHTTPGEFRLINTQPEMLVLQETQVNIISVNPNPADKIFSVTFRVNKQGTVNIDIINDNGQLAMSAKNINAVAGINSVKLNAADLNSGSYRVVVRMDKSSGSENLIITR